MPLLRLTAVSLSTPSELLLDSVDAILVEGERVGLVGPNGSGKSTLLKMLAADDDERGGSGGGREGEGEDPSAYCTLSSGKIDGMLCARDRPVGSVLMVGQDELSWSKLFLHYCDEEDLRELPLPDAIDLAVAQGMEEALEDGEAWRELCTAATRAQLGWDVAHYDDTPLCELSPGCALRAYLAIACHRSSVRLLLLDEPTNHLDLPSILWLQHTLIESGKTVIVVSHDESFLDVIGNHVWEIDDEKRKLTTTSSKYSDFKHAKRVRIQQQREAYDQQQKRNKKLTDVADRLRAMSKAGEHHIASDHDLLQRDFRRDRAGRSGKKASAVEKLRDSQEKVEKVVEHIPLKIRLEPLAANVSSTILVDQVKLGYTAAHAKGGGGQEEGEGKVEGREDVCLPLPPISLRVDYGERIAIIGYNGIGKTTLLRTLTKAIPPLEGAVSIGQELRIGNLMQEHESLPRDTTPRDHVASITGLDRFAGGNRLIRGYGLTLHQVNNPIRELNPGARARLLLALFALRSVNVLVLDEPTNHLDEEAVTEVAATVNKYSGSVIVVSHDRAFLAGLELTRTYALTPVEGLVEVESVDAFVEGVEEKVKKVVAMSFK
eukprot:CAMPEP_0113896544 /NCGR_PEP_ID=MMETSP0780_2-20120614/18102_1 /TAXON_ID=652834 /ORGANISM="Palpitomonas bilix" /LENGTH=603 /DNA_ID=CAMNT_0000887747 /DNA_START=92 /DNA_END=1903 /DNA_ORIENTATION=+ /assembly_acc=CAM_ASM_000599